MSIKEGGSFICLAAAVTVHSVCPSSFGYHKSENHLMQLHLWSYPSSMWALSTKSSFPWPLTPGCQRFLGSHFSGKLAVWTNLSVSSSFDCAEIIHLSQNIPLTLGPLTADSGSSSPVCRARQWIYRKQTALPSLALSFNLSLNMKFLILQFWKQKQDNIIHTKVCSQILVLRRMFQE